MINYKREASTQSEEMIRCEQTECTVCTVQNVWWKKSESGVKRAKWPSVRTEYVLRCHNMAASWSVRRAISWLLASTAEAAPYLLFHFESDGLKVEVAGRATMRRITKAFRTSDQCTSVRTILPHLHVLYYTYCTLYTQYMFPFSLFPMLRFHLQRIYSLTFTLIVNISLN